MRIHFISIVFFLGLTCFYPCDAKAEETPEQLQQKPQDLSSRAAKTTDPQELMQITQELQKIMQQLANTEGAFGKIALGRAKTPEEEVDRQIKAINRGYSDVMGNLMRHKTDDERLLPITLATKIRGHIVVRGKDEAHPRNGWIPMKLGYTVREDFVGHLTITRYYDMQARRFSGKREYMLASISTNIRVPNLTGRQCTETHSAPLVKCGKWRSFSTYDVDEGDVYSAIHEWVILGATEKNIVEVEVEAPSLYFRSSDRKAGRELGCFGAKFKMDIAEFEEALQKRTIVLNKQIGSTSSATPGCKTGSSVKLEMTVCDPADFANLDRCRQTQMLLEDLKYILKLRDAFKKMGSLARSPDHLIDLVTAELSTEYPGNDLKDEEYLAQSAGGYNFCNQQISMPDLCKACLPRPLCRWQQEALQAHEQAHYDDAKSDPAIGKLFCDTSFQMQNYPNVEDLRRAQAETYARLDYNAYDEQARHLRDLIQQQLHSGGSCQFSPNFFADLQDVDDDLK